MLSIPCIAWVALPFHSLSLFRLPLFSLDNLASVCACCAFCASSFRVCAFAIDFLDFLRPLVCLGMGL